MKAVHPNYIIKRQYDWKALDKFLTVPPEVQLKDEKRPVAKDLALELPVVLPALRHDHIGLHIDVSDDLEWITYSIVEDDRDVFKWDGKVDYVQWHPQHLRNISEKLHRRLSSQNYTLFGQYSG